MPPPRIERGAFRSSVWRSPSWAIAADVDKHSVYHYIAWVLKLECDPWSAYTQSFFWTETKQKTHHQQSNTNGRSSTSKWTINGPIKRKTNRAAQSSTSNEHLSQFNRLCHYDHRNLYITYCRTCSDWSGPGVSFSTLSVELEFILSLLSNWKRNYFINDFILLSSVFDQNPFFHFFKMLATG